MLARAELFPWSFEPDSLDQSEGPMVAGVSMDEVHALHGASKGTGSLYFRRVGLLLASLATITLLFWGGVALWGMFASPSQEQKGSSSSADAQGAPADVVVSHSPSTKPASHDISGSGMQAEGESSRIPPSDVVEDDQEIVEEGGKTKVELPTELSKRDKKGGQEAIEKVPEPPVDPDVEPNPPPGVEGKPQWRRCSLNCQYTLRLHEACIRKAQPGLRGIANTGCPKSGAGRTSPDADVLCSDAATDCDAAGCDRWTTLKVSGKKYIICERTPEGGMGVYHK